VAKDFAVPLLPPAAVWVWVSSVVALHQQSRVATAEAAVLLVRHVVSPMDPRPVFPLMESNLQF